MHSLFEGGFVGFFIEKKVFLRTLDDAETIRTYQVREVFLL